MPEYEDYNRAMDFLEPKIIHRWCVSKNKYAHTWQGLKKLIGNRYGRSSEHSARDKLSRLTWKGSVEQLDRNLREALDVCIQIFEKQSIIRSSLTCHIACMCTGQPKGAPEMAMTRPWRSV